VGCFDGCTIEWLKCRSRIKSEKVVAINCVKSVEVKPLGQCYHF